MKFTSKLLASLIGFLVAGLFIGSLAWEVLERIIHLVPSLENFSLTMEKPVQIFDLYVISLSFRANPGSFIGLVGGGIFFFAL